ncbi:ABC transporter substrate-binding protein [Streptacidiphilus sp. EB129]|uniref:ABC transporter substrate-binding protein n=1 Tax=Streptacidiphilus sp. EB129 TaxID=3156262 RepID=UPI003516FE5B
MLTRRARSTAALAVTALALGAAVAGCSSSAVPATTAPSAAPSAPASVADLTARSHSESGLIMYGNTPSAVMKPLLDSFTKAYPWIRPQYSQLSDNQVYTKFESEHAQSARTADLLISDSIPQALQAETSGLIADVTPQGLADFPAYVNQGHGMYVMSPDPVLATWNPRLISGARVPTTYAQLAADAKANPSTYPLVSYSPANPLGYNAVYGLVHVLGADQTYSDLDALGPRTKTFDEGLDGLNHLVGGAASFGWLASGLSQSVIPQYKGLAAYGYMQDATPLTPRLVAQTAGAASPASAQLFLDFVYSNPGQQVMCAAGMEASMTNFQSATGCTADLTDLAKHVPAGTTYLVPVSQDVVNQQKTITDRWNKALGR